MAHDDMHVIMYKVLAYLYDCLKHGVHPDKTALSATGPLFGGVPESYWVAIWNELVKKGLVTGVIIKSLDNSLCVIDADPQITFDGVEFMNENSMMKKALGWLKDAKSALPFI